MLDGFAKLIKDEGDKNNKMGTGNHLWRAQLTFLWSPAKWFYIWNSAIEFFFPILIPWVLQACALYTPVGNTTQNLNNCDVETVFQFSCTLPPPPQGASKPFASQMPVCTVWKILPSIKSALTSFKTNLIWPEVVNICITRIQIFVVTAWGGHGCPWPDKAWLHPAVTFTFFLPHDKFVPSERFQNQLER